MAVGISNWAETPGERFDITKARENETDEELIARAKSLYSDDLEIEVEYR